MKYEISDLTFNLNLLLRPTQKLLHIITFYCLMLLLSNETVDIDWIPLSIPFLSRVMRHFTTHPCGDGSKTKASKLSIISARAPMPRSSSSLYKLIDKTSIPRLIVLLHLNDILSIINNHFTFWWRVIIYLSCWIISLCICFITSSITICFFCSIS